MSVRHCRSCRNGMRWAVGLTRRARRIEARRAECSDALSHLPISRVVEARHGGAWACRALEGLGAISGPPCHLPARTRNTEARHGFAGACRTFGGLGAISGPPCHLPARTRNTEARHG